MFVKLEMWLHVSSSPSIFIVMLYCVVLYYVMLHYAILACQVQHVKRNKSPFILKIFLESN